VRPLVNIQVQIWVREVSRMLRAVASEPEFSWWHDGPETGTRHLPAAYCRVCGRSGWMAATTELGDTLSDEAVAAWRNSARPAGRAKTRALLVAGREEQGVSHLDPETFEIHAAPGDNTLPVHVSDSDEDAVNEVCPSCAARNSIRFMGSSVATLLSVGLTTEFGSRLLATEEKKTLVFTDSVQDAAHRAAFIEGRAFAFNFRSALYRGVGDGTTTLAAAIDRLTGDTSTDDLYAITPPDFARRLGVVSDWLDHDPGNRTRRLLATRLAFESQLEVGLRSRTGRTLELTSALSVDIDVDLDVFTARAREAHQNLPQLSLVAAHPADKYRTWLLGLLDHLRVNGGILHPWLNTYIKDEGKRWSIWGFPEAVPHRRSTPPAWWETVTSNL
jgi:hypothetical protein